MSQFTTSLISSASVILAVALGGFVAKRYADYRESIAIRSAIAAELRALLAIADRRHYVELLEQFVGSLPEIWDGRAFQPFVIRVGHNYKRVFDSVAKKLGLLPSRLAERVVTVYYHIQAVLEDFELSVRAAAHEPDSTWLLTDYHTFRAFNLQCFELLVETRHQMRDLIDQLDPPPS